jgi:6-phosphogluconolactonase (cycloisomerase 2 family)
MNAPPGKALFVYVGAFTMPERKGKGDGINVYRMDPSSGVWTHLQLVPNVVNPSFLALDREQRFLYSVHADLDGTLGARTDLAMLSGEAGPNRKEHASSHPHDCPFDPAGRFILVADKGLDRVFSFKLDSASGKLTPNDPPFTATREGAGPRHIAFHPAMSHAYVIDELDSTMTTYRYDPARGALQPVQVVPTVPPSFTGNNSGGGGRRRPVGAFCVWLEPRA